MFSIVLGIGLVICGFQIGRYWAAYQIAKNAQTLLILLKKHQPELFEEQD